jgi:hypothetical protein
VSSTLAASSRPTRARRSTVVLRDVVLALAESWERDARDRQRVSAHDPQADTFSFCAKELRDRLTEATAPGRLLTVAEYATQQGVHRNTILRWIKRGELLARPTEAGLRIPVGARRVARPEGDAT